MKQTKRNLFLIYPGMTPSYEVFMAFLEEGRQRSSEVQEPVPEVRQDVTKRSFRWVKQLMRRSTRTRVSV